MGNIWGGKKWRPADMPKKQPKINQSIEELLKPLSEKSFKGNVWGSQIMNVEKETTTPIVSPSPTPTVTPTQSVTPSITPSVTPSISVTPTPTPTITPTPSSSTPLLVVGQSYQGGKIAYLLQSGDPGYDANVQHGLVITTGDTALNVTWGCQGTSISTGGAIGDGQSNTTNIVNGCATPNIAARICNDLVENGYSDWYLPSIGELNSIYPNRGLLGMTTGEYWSSSQSDANNAWERDFVGSDYPETRLKGSTSDKRVRAVRSF